MPNQIRTLHTAKIRLTTHRISRSEHALGVKSLGDEILDVINVIINDGKYQPTLLKTDSDVLKNTLHKFFEQFKEMQDMEVETNDGDNEAKGEDHEDNEEEENNT